MMLRELEVKARRYGYCKNKDIMETREISLALKSEAVSLGLCQEWTSEWDNESKDSLVEKYVKGIDFCIDHNYPSLAFMKENFDGVMQKHGVFAMEEVSVFNRRFLDINHSCVGSAKNNSYFDTDGYVRGNSVMDIVALENSSFHISLYDTSILNIRVYDNAKVYVYKYGGTVNVEIGEDRVFIREKSK